MSKYVDICIQPVPKKNLEDYRKTTRQIGKLLVELGALASRDYVSEDRNASELSFPKKIKLKKGEVIIVALAEFKSRAHRDQVFKRMEKDERMQKIFSGPNFLDQKRAIVGGFSLLVAV